MANFRLTYTARNAVIYSTTLAFTLASISPVYGFQPQQCAVNLNDINMAIKFEKLIEKAWKYFKAKVTIAYARGSSHDQKEDLKRQAEVLASYWGSAQNSDYKAR